MRIFIPIVMLILALLLVIFGAQNTQAVNVKFLGVETGMASLALVIVISAVFGAVLTGLLGLWIRIRYGIRSWRANKQRASLEAHNRELEQRVAALESENANLREAQPAKVAEPEPGAKDKVAG
ncbi:MAG: lipopolysaccharide assembly LapA domain-containing protein [Roseiflexaceae bacterium]